MPSFSHQPLPISKAGRQRLEQCRSASISPQSRDNIASPRDSSNELGLQGRSTAGLPLGSAGFAPETVLSSMDLISTGFGISSPSSASESSQAQIIRRLIQQNSRLREAWEAERKYLEANRERAEEVYKEERALMEEEREAWEAERTALLQEIQRLRQQVVSLSGGATQSVRNGSSVSSPTTLPTGARGDAVKFLWENTKSSHSPQGRLPPLSASDVPSNRNGLYSPRSLFQQAGGIRQDQPILNGMSVLTLKGPRTSTPDFLKPSTTLANESGPMPVVDVHEIDPELEGIRIKAAAVKKPTFADHVGDSDSGVSKLSDPPATTSVQPRSARTSNPQTLEVLAAKESDRLTMHAGHTPNHSLSSVATVTSSATATATANGGDSTPAAQGANDMTVQRAAVSFEEASDTPEPAQSTALVKNASQGSDYDPYDNEPEPLFIPDEDRPLRGPLMVRNMPAHDEIFFQKLADKLEEVSKDDEAALPAVLKSSADSYEQQQKLSDGVDKDNGGTESAEESEVPLKFKNCLNFGAPFGAIR
jgi:hypothetical protein